MTKDEVFTQLREAFGLDSTLNRFKPLEPLDGLREVGGGQGTQDAGCGLHEG